MIFEDQLDRIVPRDLRLESPLLLPACLATRHRYRAEIGGLELEQLLRLVVLIGSMIAGTWCNGLSSSKALSSGYRAAVPLETQVFQCLDTGRSHRRYLSFCVQPVIAPLVTDPPTQLGVFAVVCRNIAVPVLFAIVGKLAQTTFPYAAEVVPPFETQVFQCLDTVGGHRCLSLSVLIVILPLA
jgi:hypothetical protein